MCGIVGMMTFGGGAMRWRASIAHAMNLMARRGPDAAGLWSDERCVLGFRRLSILDLSEKGNQPMLTRDGRYALVFNGELYNFREIRATLGARGVHMRSTGDAEVVLYALAEFGEAALASFNGMFALAFYDTHARRLLLARDHAAIKPLYLLQHRDGLLFASQYDQLLSHPWSRERAVSPGALGLYLNLGYIPPPFALLTGTTSLEAGAWLSVDDQGDVRTGQHFVFPRARVPDLHGRDAFEAVDRAVTSAVRRQMVSDVPVGVLLSGGIDSPLVAAVMAASSNATIPAYTVGTRDRAIDESPDARRYADAIGLRHVVQHVTSADVLELLDTVVTASSEPADDYSFFPTTLVSRMARTEVTVALSGDGGDDIFWGYPGRMIHPLRMVQGLDEGWPARAWRGLANLAAGTKAAAIGVSARSAAAPQLARSRFVSIDDLRAVLPSLPSLPDAFTLFDFSGDTADDLAQWLRWNEYTGHLGRVLQKVDRASMHQSLEIRVPLLDREVIDVATRVDWRSAVSLGRKMGKLPLRAALERRIGFQTRRKRGFEVPMGAWLRGPLRPLLEDLLVSRQDLLGLPLNRAALRRIVRRHHLRLESSTWLLWRILSLALWDARHFKPAPVHA